MRPIVLVEDNEDDLFFMKLAIKRAEIQNPLLVASDGQQAIELLRQAAHKDLSSDGAPALPCLILLDLKLPRVPGHEVLKWIREQPALKSIPTIVLTASRDDRDIETAYRLGASSYFAKPSETDTLVEIVKLLRDYWLKHCVPPPACAGKAAALRQLVQNQPLALVVDNDFESPQHIPADMPSQPRIGR